VQITAITPFEIIEVEGRQIR